MEEALAFGPATSTGPIPSRDFVLCTLCRNVSAEAVASTHGFKWHERGRDLYVMKSQCDLCRYIYDCWHSVPAQDDARSLLNDAHGLNNVQNLRIKAIPGDPGPEHGLEMKILCNSFGHDRVIPVPNLYLLVSSDSPWSSSGFSVINKTLTSTESEETFDFIKSCLAECASLHDCTSSLTSNHSQTYRPSMTPARLLDVTPSFDVSPPYNDAVRLVDVGQHCPKYITLSHCWGKTISGEHITTTSNIDSRKSSIDVSELPLNFRHAVQITRRLHVRYLWIDSLCIIQDSADDWRSESVKMGAIYQCSFLTISANMGGDSTCGCFNEKSQTRDQLPRFEVGGGQLIDITTQNAEGEANSFYILKQGTVYTPAPLAFTPLSDRGWIYQERILSPRTLHFTPAQLVWECRRMYRMEDFMPTPYSDEISPTTSALLGKTYLASAGDLLDVWQSEIVQRDYSGRVFTKSEDKLIAIAGIAQIMQQHLGCAYVAGLWEDHLAHGLGFWLTGPRKLGPAPRRPTWAWSSHDKRVMWWGVNNNFRPYPHFRFVKECLEYAGDASNPFNPVRGGFITIEAAPVSFTIPHPPTSDFSPLKLSMGEFEGKCRIDYPWLFREMGDFPRRLEGILLGHTKVEAMSFLLVVEPDQSRGGYRRIGYAHIYFPDQDERDTFWLTKTQFQQTWSIY